MYSIWISLSAAGSGVSRSPSLLSGATSVSTRDTEGPGHCGSVLITEEVVGVGDKVRSTTVVVHKCFEASFNMFLGRLRWSRGSVLAFSTQVRGFKPGRSRQIFKGEKILSTPSFGGEVKLSVPCRRFAAYKRSLNVAWKSTFRQNYRTILAHEVPPFATRVSRVGVGALGCGTRRRAVHPRRMPRALTEKKKMFLRSASAAKVSDLDLNKFYYNTFPIFL